MKSIKELAIGLGVILLCACPVPAQVVYSKKHPELSAMMDARKLQSVVSSCTKILAANPDDDEALYFRAAAAFDTNSDRFGDQALQDINRAIRLHPNQAPYHYVRAKILHHAQEDSDALTDIQMACRLDPKQSTFLLLQADILMFLRRFDDAIACATKSEKLERKITPAAQQTIGRALMDESHFDAAIQHLSAALKIDPNNVIYRTDRIRAAERAHHWELIIDDASYVISNSKSGKLSSKIQAADYYHWRAQAYAVLKQYSKALSDYDQAIKLNPEVRELHVEAYHVATLLSDKERMRKEKTYLDGFDRDFQPL